MQIKINGVVEIIAEEKLHIARLLEMSDVESPQMVSVQLNGDIVDHANFEKTAVLDNDEVEFLYFMGGGN